MSNHRRDQARTDETTLSEGMARALKLSDMLESEAACTLARNLSTRSTTSTTSTFARRMNLARNTINRFVVIGRGTCGTVYEIPGKQHVVKVGSKANINGLWRDFVFANRAHNAMRRAADILQDYAPGLGLELPHVPQSHEFHRHDDEMFWTEDMCQKFPGKEHVKRPLFICDRVLPLPRETREALIRMFFPAEKRQEAAEDPKNDACLIRPYFGENTPSSAGWVPDTLWNFPLYANTMRALRLDCNTLVKEMALGIAALHWSALIEASDVEFMIGTSTKKPTVPEGYTPHPVNIYQYNFERRATHLYLIDFDKSREFSLKEPSAEIVRKLVVGVTGNDPYYPNPTVDTGLWSDFAKTYVEASERILAATTASQVPADDRGRIMELPKQFVNAWEENMHENQDYNAGELILFEEEDDEDDVGGGYNDDQGWGSDEVDDEVDEDSEEDDSDIEEEGHELTSDK